MNAPPKRMAARENLGGQVKTVPGGIGKANDSAITPSPQQPSYVVIESKDSGREVVVGHYDDRAMALSVVRLLAWAGASARVESAP